MIEIVHFAWLKFPLIIPRIDYRWDSEGLTRVEKIGRILSYKGTNMELKENSIGLIMASVVLLGGTVLETCSYKRSINGVEALNVEMVEPELSGIQIETVKEVKKVYEVTPALDNVRGFLGDDSIEPGPIDEVLQGLDDRQWKRLNGTYVARMVLKKLDELDPEFRSAYRKEHERRGLE